VEYQLIYKKKINIHRMKKINLKLIVILGLIISNSGCFSDLNTLPLDTSVITSEVVYNDPASYKKVLAKLYAGFAVSGQEGPAGKSDVLGLDEGFGQYLRGYWYHQELPTDEAIIGWNDQTIQDFHKQTWSDGDNFIYGFYSRAFFQISACNEFIRQTTDEKLNERGNDATLKEQIKNYRAEVRFLRAISYWHALDLFRNVPFVTENDIVGKFLPKQTTAADLFKYIETELLAIENEIAAPRTNEYARADRAAVWMLLSKLYLNAEVYTGQKKYAEALTYSEKVINAGYTLEPKYQNLFLADNHTSKEIIFPIAFDGVNTRTWGGMTFIIRAGIGAKMDPEASGVSGGWAGTRTTKEFVNKFPSNTSGLVVEANPGATASYPKVYVPGSHQTNPFDPTDTKNALSSPLKNRIYEGYVYFPKDNGEFVFARNPTLSGKLGDTNKDGKLETEGANIIIPKAGMYYIKVDLNTGVNTYTIEKQSWAVIGNATAGGWNTETPMTFDLSKRALKANIELTAGEIKFRANNAWDINLGDKGADAILDFGGDNIKIDKPGTYEILLFLDKPDYTYQLALTSFDRRGLFFKDGQALEISKVDVFTDGIAINKFKNITSTGAKGKDVDFPDTDFPMFRLADAYLMASEALLRINGDKTKAANYYNAVRERAFTGKAGNVAPAELTLDQILDERGRELYWEGHRRTDLVRFGQLTDGNYLWQWKGGVQAGKKTEKFRNVFPIPSKDLNANPTLKQNEGY
jgi:hypothetical protein